MDAVKDIIINKVAPLNDTLNFHTVQTIHGCWDYKSWLSPLDLNVAGHTSTAGKKANNVTEPHSFRFLRREDYEKHAYLYHESHAGQEIVIASRPWPNPDLGPNVHTATGP